MRCLHCHWDDIPPNADTCPNCHVHLPSLMRDVLPPNTSLNNGAYVIDTPLGRGGFGITYLATHRHLGRQFAVKEFYPRELVNRHGTTMALDVPTSQQEAYRRGLQRFLDEGRILGALNHRNIVKVTHYFQERNTGYLVMELINGPTLKAKLAGQAGKKLPLGEVREIMDQLVSALEAAHGKQVYHLDIKPDNVLIDSDDGKVVLVDFGAARRGLSSDSTRAFTLEYAAPEVLAQKEVGPQSDIFELGMMLYEMLTGERPTSALGRLSGENWKPRELEEPWRSLVKDALDLDKERRSPSVHAWWYGTIDAVKKRARALRDWEEGERRRFEEERRREIERQEELERERRRKEAERERELKWQIEQSLKQGHPGYPPAYSPASQPIQPRNRSRRIGLYASLLLFVLLTGAAGTYLLLNNRLKTFAFETARVNASGQVVNREKKTASYFAEDLGDGVKLDMVEIRGGTFEMGTASGGYPDERPSHQVTLQTFFLGKFEVTQSQWRAVARWPKVNRDLVTDPSSFKGDNLPVELISWEDATEFCERLTRKTKRKYRLPSESEWEYACRAGSTGEFYFGDKLAPEIANYRASENAGTTGFRRQTIPVGSLGLANAFGLYDMHGNVYEMCLDFLHANYQGAPTDGSAWLQDGLSARILRGGSWYDPPEYCRSAFRNRSLANKKNDINGLRVAAEASRQPLFSSSLFTTH